MAAAKCAIVVVVVLLFHYLSMEHRELDFRCHQPDLVFFKNDIRGTCAVDFQLKRLPDIANCDEKHEFFQQFTTSSYSYNSVIEQFTVNSSTRLEINCRVTVDSFENCYHTLKVIKCNIIETTSVGNLIPEVTYNVSLPLAIRYPLTFAMAKGVIQTLYVHKNEDVEILNLKRGILSSLLGKKLIGRFKLSEMRSDVQGLCQVIYAKIDTGLILIKKNINDCWFPDNPNKIFSPFSLLQNTSFVQKHFINATATCLQRYDGDGLKSSYCLEFHVFRMPSADTKSFIYQTKVLQTLLSEGISSNPDLLVNVTEEFIRKDILYEYVKHAPGDLKGLSTEELVYEHVLSCDISGNRLQPSKATSFSELVFLLRSLTDLDHVEGFLMDKISSHHNQLNVISIFIDGLVHCNTVPCIRAFRRILQGPNRPSEIFIQFLMHFWSFSPVHDASLFEEFYKICSIERNFICPLALSSAIHFYWDSLINKDKFPSGLTESVEFLYRFIEKCDDEEECMLLALKIISNLGEIAEKPNPFVQDALVNCTVNSSLSWTVRLSAIQAFHRFPPTTRLYNRIVNFLKDSSLPLEMRVESFRIFISKWPNNETLTDLARFLVDCDSYQLKMFIMSHLKMVASRTDPQSIKFGRLIRMAMTVVPQFYELQLENDVEGISSSKEISTLYRFPDININNQFGFRFVFSNLFDEKYYFPTVLLLNTATQFLDNQYQFESFYAFKDRLSSPTRLRFNGTLEYDNLDDAIVEKMRAIFNEFSLKHNLPEYPEFLFYYRIFESELGFLTNKTFRFMRNNLKTKLFQLINQRIHSFGAMVIVDSLHSVPLLSGVHLTWSTKVVLLHGVNLTKSGATVPFDLSGSVVVVNEMSHGVPSHSDIKISSVRHVSSDVSGSIELDFNKAGAYRLSFQPPQHEMNLFTFSHDISTSSSIGSHDKENMSMDYKKSCLDKFVSYTGMKLCRINQYLVDYDDTKNILLPQTKFLASAITIHFLETFVKKYELEVFLDQSEVNLNVMLLKDNEEKKELLTAHFVAGESVYCGEISQNLSHLNDFVITCNVTIVVFKEFVFKYLAKEKEMKRDVARLGNANICEKIYEAVVTLGTPDADFLLNHTRVVSPVSETSGVHLYYIEKPLSQGYSVAHRIFPGILWENDYKLWLKLCHEKYRSEINNIRSPQLTQTSITIPVSRWEIHTFSGQTTDDQYKFDFNVTQHLNSGSALQTFCNVSYTYDETRIGDTSFEKRFCGNITIPRWSLGFEAIHLEDGSDKNLSLILKRFRMIPLSKQYASWVGWWPDSSSLHFFKLESFETSVDASYRNESAKQVLLGETKHARRVPFNVSASVVLMCTGYDAVNISGNYFSTTQKYPKKIGVDLMFYNPNWDVGFKSHVRYDSWWIGSASFLYHSEAELFSGGSKATYKLDGGYSLLSGLYFNEDLVSPFFNMRSVNTLFPSISLNVTASSPIWEFLTYELQQIVYFSTGESMNFTHPLMDISVVADWREGYNKVFDFKSKNLDILPSMLWVINFTRSGGVVRFNFPNAYQNIPVYLIVNVSTNCREIQFTFCQSRQCLDIETDPDTMITQWTYILNDPTHLVEIVTNNEAVSSRLMSKFNKKIKNMHTIILNVIRDPQHPLNKICWPLLKTTIAEWYARKLLDSIFTYNIIREEVFDTLSTVVVESDPAQFITKISDAFLYIDLIVADVYRNQVTSLNYGRNYVRKFELPVWMVNFTNVKPNPKLSCYLNEMLYLGNFLQDLLPRKIIHNSAYTRFALFWDQQYVRTFDGNVIDLIPLSNERGCSYLLLSEKENRNVTVAFELGNLHFWFRRFYFMLHLTTGQIYLNNDTKATELPHYVSFSNVQLTRIGNIIEIEMVNYLKVMCVMQSNNHCLFSTTKYAHYRFIGLFGNNNNDPTDDFKGVSGTHKEDIQSLFQLTSSPYCSETNLGNCSYNLKQKSFCSKAFSYESETFVCHDHINPVPFCDRCLRSESCGLSSGCSSVLAYTSLCAARGLPIKESSSECGFCNGIKSGETWKGVVESIVEFIFVVEPAFKSQLMSTSKSSTSFLQTLVKEIDKSFTRGGFVTNYGLVIDAEQVTINGKLLSSAEDLLHFWPEDVLFNNHSGSQPSVLDSIEISARQYSLNPKAVHLFVILAAHDGVHDINWARLAAVKELMKNQGGIVYSVSEYPSPTKDSKMSTTLMGPFAMLASSTGGSYYSVKRFFRQKAKNGFATFAEKMVGRSQEDVGLCRYCRCLSPSYIPHLKCYHYNCKSTR